MPEGEHVDGVVGWLVAIERDVSGVAISDHQLSQLGSFGEGTTDVGGCFQQQEMPFDGLTDASRRLRRLFGQKGPASFQAGDGTFSDDYSWHFGTGFSSAVPQVFSQLRASSLVRWRPVS